MSKQLKLGMIGLDTSHVTAFASILNDPAHPYHVPGGAIAAAYPGVPLPDFELSYGRVGRYTEELQRDFGVRLLISERAVAEACDAVMIVSVDGRVHLDQFRKIAGLGKPVFIDKPFAVSTRQAQDIAATAARFHVPLMSCSALRYAEALTEELRNTALGAVTGADCYGPMALQPSQPGLFWYGIHLVEMLYRVLGRGCKSVVASTSKDHDCVTGIWQDGRIGTIRGNRTGNYDYGALIHRGKETAFVNVGAHPKPVYASMLERVMAMFQSGKPEIDMEETLEIVRFIECANKSRETGQQVELEETGFPIME